MTRNRIILIILIGIVGIGFVVWRFLQKNPDPSENTQENPIVDQSSETPDQTPEQNENDQAKPDNSQAFIWPLDRTDERTTKKVFGTYVTPQNSPVQPERFSGYHTGLDFETFENEANMDVAVKIICGGVLRTVARANGYGGYAVQECSYNNEAITVVYGHIATTSVTAAIGSYLAPGSILGRLGNVGPETDNERKHLHLSIHRGSATNIRGYVSTQSALSEWFNPRDLLAGVNR